MRMTAVPSEPPWSLRQPLSAELGIAAESLQVSLLYRGDLADSTSIHLAKDGAGRPLGVVLWSPGSAPEAVGESMRKAATAAAALPAAAASHVLLPVAQGRVEGRSYAVLPYCKSLSDFRPMWWLQRRTAGRFVTSWLREVCKTTVSTVSSAAVEASFEKPLARLAACEHVGPQVREAARSAQRRLLSGAWQARHVLMHADLWKGNLLVRAPSPGAAEPWGERLCLIDWGASEVLGHALFDLLRATEAFRIESGSAARELAGHCEILQCEAVDAQSHLAAALAHVFCHLGRFPVQRFASMAEACCATLGRLGAAAR